LDIGLEFDLKQIKQLYSCGRMCKELPVILDDRVVEKKKIIGKMGG
jgi:hypothetical protein